MHIITIKKNNTIRKFMFAKKEMQQKEVELRSSGKKAYENC